MPAKSNDKKDKFKVSTTFDIPKDGQRYKARKLQILIRQMDKLALYSVDKVDIKNYIALLDEFTKTIEGIKNDTGRVAAKRHTSTTPGVGNGTPPSELAGISADNPFAGAGADNAAPVRVPAENVTGPIESSD
jgi:hypothetical protein